MFRKLFPILPVLAALYLAVSCDPNGKEPVVNDTLTVSPESISFEAEDKAVKLVYVSTEKEWGILEYLISCSFFRVEPWR